MRLLSRSTTLEAETRRRVGEESAEAPRRLFVPVYRYRHVDFGGPDIYACGIRPKDRQAENRLCVLLCSLPSYRIARRLSPACRRSRSFRHIVSGFVIAATAARGLQTKHSP